MSIRRRLRGAGAAPTSGRHHWVAIALVVTVLVVVAVWVGAELSGWPPEPPHEAR
jgi:hypothetical protein